MSAKSPWLVGVLCALGTVVASQSSATPAAPCTAPAGANVLQRGTGVLVYVENSPHGRAIYRGCTKGHGPHLLRPKPCQTDYLTLCRLNAFHAVDGVIGFGETIIYTDAVQLRVAVRDLNDGRLLFFTNAITQQFPAPTNRTYGVKAVRFVSRQGIRTVWRVGSGVIGWCDGAWVGSVR